MNRFFELMKEAVSFLFGFLFLFSFAFSACYVLWSVACLLPDFNPPFFLVPLASILAVVLFPFHQ